MLMIHNLLHDFKFGNTVNLRGTLDLKYGKCKFDGNTLHMKEQHNLNEPLLRMNSKQQLHQKPE